MLDYFYSSDAGGQVAMKADADDAIAASHADGQKVGANAERARILSIANSNKLAENASAFKAALTLAADAPDMSADKVIEFALKTGNAEAPANNPASLQNRLNGTDALGELLSSGQQSQASETANTLPNASEVFASRRKAKAEPFDGQR
ncbi:hypothetical protein [Ahrensia marina]|uniref:Scaffolding protein n=1 Tax=Ahrensia marina TaxID=1514904 RepID=A0A0M9GMJ6_9HYPH|nr:hypothetical protein [Ahrensia marina]KPB01367.1 hypothetical protein SU32_08955 [Ahrensia marina]